MRYAPAREDPQRAGSPTIATSARREQPPRPQHARPPTLYAREDLRCLRSVTVQEAAPSPEDPRARMLALHPPTGCPIRHPLARKVSTAKQGASGLGIEAQRASVLGFLNSGAWTLEQEVMEVESGKRNDRPALAQALRLCKKMKATLVIAKLDRLARNITFISNLMESGVEFVAVDMPQATKFTIHIMAAVAEQEVEAIFKRTIALAATKARGTKLGGRRVSAERQAEIAAGARAAHAKKSSSFAASLAPVIKEIKDSGATTLLAIAAELNSRYIDTARGGSWSAVQVSRVLAQVVGMSAGQGSIADVLTREVWHLGCGQGAPGVAPCDSEDPLLG